VLAGRFVLGFGRGRNTRLGCRDVPVFAAGAYFGVQPKGDRDRPMTDAGSPRTRNPTLFFMGQPFHFRSYLLRVDVHEIHKAKSLTAPRPGPDHTSKPKMPISRNFEIYSGPPIISLIRASDLGPSLPQRISVTALVPCAKRSIANSYP